VHATDAAEQTLAVTDGGEGTVFQLYLNGSLAAQEEKRDIDWRLSLLRLLYDRLPFT